MRRKRNMSQMKEQNKTPGKVLNKMEISNQSDAEFKTQVIKLLKELGETFKGLSETFRELKKTSKELSKNINNIKKYQSEMKDALTEIENNLQELNSRVGIVFPRWLIRHLFILVLHAFRCPTDILLLLLLGSLTRKQNKKKGVKEKASNEKQDEIEKIKSHPFMEGEPEDDVYLKHLYPRQIYVKKVIHLLKKFQILDYTNPKQGIYLDLTLDMALGKKKKVEPFSSVLSLPYPLVSEINKVAVFTWNASEIKISEENGALFAGGTNLIQEILDGEIKPDFYVLFQK
uniref:Uncharacterized protein n=1 Tax=Molossus molossus TaxID=27622 RepID=A0A7J8I9G4_MOLMO|nr:hypothetical protein HJG59_010684 [Molossus molossus]